MMLLLTRRYKEFDRLRTKYARPADERKWKINRKDRKSRFWVEPKTYCLCLLQVASRKQADGNNQFWRNQEGDKTVPALARRKAHANWRAHKSRNEWSESINQETGCFHQDVSRRMGEIVCVLEQREIRHFKFEIIRVKDVNCETLGFAIYYLKSRLLKIPSFRCTTSCPSSYPGRWYRNWVAKEYH